MLEQDRQSRAARREQRNQYLQVRLPREWYGCYRD